MAQNPTFVITMADGREMKGELYPETAPQSVGNFIALANSGFYDGLIFHRVIPGFMVQGGGFDVNMQEKANNKAPIKNESSNGLQNKRGTLAMARTNQPDSARAQFFVNLVDNDFLDRSARNAGYAVFGKVTKGMDIVDQIAKVPTRNYGMHQNVPVNPVKITSVTIKAPVVKN